MEEPPFSFIATTSNLPSVKHAPSLGDLLASLPEEERVVLSLHYLKGMDSLQIAHALGVPDTAVVTVIEKGKRRLLEALDFPPLA